MDALAPGIAEKLGALGLLLGAVLALWRAFGRANDKLIDTLTANNHELVAKLEAVRTSLESGLSTLRHEVDNNRRRLEAAERRLEHVDRRVDHHAEVVGALAGASGTYVHREPPPSRERT